MSWLRLFDSLIIPQLLYVWSRKWGFSLGCPPASGDRQIPLDIHQDFINLMGDQTSSKCLHLSSVGFMT